MPMGTSIKCPACDRDYGVKPELAGQRAKCKCGQVLHFPALATALAEGPGALQVIPQEAKDDKPQRGRSAIFDPLDVTETSRSTPASATPPPAGMPPTAAGV